MAGDAVRGNGHHVRRFFRVLYEHRERAVGTDAHATTFVEGKLDVEKIGTVRDEPCHSRVAR